MKKMVLEKKEIELDGKKIPFDEKETISRLLGYPVQRGNSIDDLEMILNIRKKLKEGNEILLDDAEHSFIKSRFDEHKGWVADNDAVIEFLIGLKKKIYEPEKI